ncbi:MAG: DUF2461 domain-containing protein [Rhodospirillales bacterium]
MAAGFAGFPKEGIQFLRALKKNNRREWFQPRKHIYESQVRAPMLELAAALNAEMMEFAPAYVREPAEAVFRIYRDTRFSHDKTPYKTHIAAVFTRRGYARHAGAGLYFSVAPDEVEVAAGVYMPTPETLRAIRLHLLEHHEEFRRIISAEPLRELMGELQGERLTRVPKGCPADHPAADLVRYKQWLFWTLLDPPLALTPKLFDEIVARFRVLTPFVEFLNLPLRGAKQAPPLDLFLQSSRSGRRPASAG